MLNEPDFFNSFYRSIYTTYIKFGIGRATYDVSQELRNGHLSIEEGKKLMSESGIDIITAINLSDAAIKIAKDNLLNKVRFINALFEDVKLTNVLIIINITYYIILILCRYTIIIGIL